MDVPEYCGGLSARAKIVKGGLMCTFLLCIHKPCLTLVLSFRLNLVVESLYVG